LVVAGYLDVTLYGADTTGGADSTSAIQSAINDASAYSMTAYVPPGTYKVSDTLSGVLLISNDGHFPTNYKFGPHSSMHETPTLVGPASGPRPTIVLQSGLASFASASHPKPLLRMVALPDPTDTSPGKPCNDQMDKEYPTAGCFDVLFSSAVRDINFKTGSNPGAIGVQFYSAQFSYMQNVFVDATGGYIGIEGGPATSDWINIEVSGGQYGVKLGLVCGTESIAGLTLENQVLAGLYINDCGGNAISGFNIQETAPNAAGIIIPSEGVHEFTTVSLLDGVVSVAGSQPAIANTAGVSLYMNDVYAHAPAVLLTNSSAAQGIAASGKTDLFAEYSHADQSTSSKYDGYALGTDNVVNDVKSQADFGTATLNAGAPPSDLVIRHLPGQMPWAFDQDAIWVTAYGADPTGQSDSTAGIRAAIAASLNHGDKVFLPRGHYALSGTIQLNPDTRFFGIPGQFTELDAGSWVTNSVYQPYIATADSKSGKAVFSDISFWMPSKNTDNTYLSALLWQTGQSSVLSQVGVQMDWLEPATFASAARKLVEVRNGGGGRWYGLQEQFNGSENTVNNPGFRALLVDGTTEPLTLYGSNPEHYKATFYEFSNASNIRVLGMKTECCHGPNLATIDNGSSNILVSGVTGDWAGGGIDFTSATNAVVNTVNFYGESSPSLATVPLITDPAAVYYQSRAIGIFKLGSGYNRSSFPHCGDNRCDGGETSASCPSDCGGGTTAPPSAAFSCTPLSGVAPLTVTCTDASSGVPTVWSWSFGDGGTSTAQNPSHAYQAAGSYTVALTAGNSSGSDRQTKSNYVTVTTASGPVTINALNLSLDGSGYEQEGTPANRIDLAASARSGTVQTAFTGATGNYDVDVRVYSDYGNDTLTLVVDGVAVGTYTYPVVGTPASYKAAWFDFKLQNVALNQGSVLQFQGKGGGSSHGRAAFSGATFTPH